MNDLACQIYETDYAVVVAPSGDVDLSTSDVLAADAACWLRPGGRLVIDCSNIDFLDSTGLRALLDVRRQAARVGAVFALACVSRAVGIVLELSGTESSFLILDRPPGDQMRTDGLHRPVPTGGKPTVYQPRRQS
jgi:anti-anti-sigma factor